MSEASRKHTPEEETTTQRSSAPERMLSTKLMPPRRHTALVARPALFARLDAGLARRLILVSGPTGFGKTTLVSQWLAERSIPYAWVTLDENDNDPVRFWSYVVTALRDLDLSLGKSALAALRTARQPALLGVLTSLINEMAALDGARVLVLEDYHAITSAEIHDTLAYLLNHLPEPLHLVLITRTGPDLPLGILRARDDLVEIEPDSLRFSREEMAAFFQQAGQAALSPSALALLEERTEGWPAGLRLAALALQGKHRPDEIGRILSTFTGSHRYVLEYLVKEVFTGLPEPVQSFVLRTSVLERFCAGLGEEVMQGEPLSVDPSFVIRKEPPHFTPESRVNESRSSESRTSQPLLDFLSQANLFITRLETEDGEPWYRYHPLFAEAVRYRARQVLGEAGLQNIYDRASRWYERHGVLDEAVEYALRARLFDRAAHLIERQAELHSMNGLLTLRRWAGQLPQETLQRHPQLSFQYAQSILYTSDRFSPATLQHIEPLLQIAEISWRAAQDNLHLGDLLSIRATVAFWQGAPRQAFAHATESLELLPDDAIGPRAVDQLFCGIEQFYMGRLPAAQERILEARALFGALQNPHGVQAAIQALSEIYFWQAALEPAGLLEQQILDEVSANVDTFESMLDDQGIAWLGLGKIAYEKNELETATQYARQALEVAEKRGNEQLLAQAVLLQARIRAAHANMPGSPAALAALADLRALETRLRSPVLLHEVQAARAWLALDIPDMVQHQAWQAAAASPGDAPGDAIFSMQKERETLVLARLRVIEGKPAEALAMLRGWREDAAAQGRARSEVEFLCLEALAHQAAGDMPRAVQAITRALGIAQAKGLRRLLLDFGPDFMRLLAQITPGLSKRSLAVYAAALQQAALLGQSGPVGRPMQPLSPVEPVALVEPLSPQELRVLRLLAAGLTNPEIAREMVVSINTIKTQVQSIYRKLNVASREEARQAAFELKIVK